MTTARCSIPLSCEAPSTLDPAVAYTTAEHVVTANVFDTLLEYHYLRRPFELIPGLATAIPEAVTKADGSQSYRFKLRDGVMYHPDPCFALSGQGQRARKAVAADVAFQLMRLADPAVNSPAASTFADVLGLSEFTKRLAEMRKADPQFAALPAHVQYERAGGVAGIVVRRRAGSRDRPGQAQPANPLLVRHALYDADAVGGGGLLRRQGRAGQPRRPGGRHRAVPARHLCQTAPVHAGAQRGLVRPSAGIRVGTRRGISCRHRAPRTSKRA